MRVLQVMASGSLGGGAAHLLGLLPALGAHSVECAAAVGEDGPLTDKLLDLGVRVEPLDLMGSRIDPRGLARLLGVVRRVSPDIVHLHGTRAAFLGAVARLGMGGSLATVYTVHGVSYRKESGRMRRAMFVAAETIACRAATRVISVSRADLLDMQQRRIIKPGAGIHVANAVDADRFCPGDRAEARQRSGLPKEGSVVGTVSRLVPQKAVGDLIDAVALCGPTQLVIVGDGPLRGELERRAEGLDGRVHFLGERDDIPEVLRSLDLFALSSHWEGEPIALLEAMATSLPCVATATAGAGELLAGAGAGIMVGIGMPERMAEAITHLRDNPDLAAQMGRAGRKLALDRTFERAAEQVMRVYGQALQ